MKKYFKTVFILILLSVFGCTNVREIVKYKTYKFDEYIQLDSLTFKPFKDRQFFKAKISIKLKTGKNYSFYSLVYSDKNKYRIFSYSFFGKKVLDIMFGIRNYVVIGNKNTLYLVEPNKIDKDKSLFYFFKDILKGIKINNAKIVNDCIKGTFRYFTVTTCEKDNYKKVFFYNNKTGMLAREFDIVNDSHIVLKIDENILDINIKENLKKTDFEKEFFKYVKFFDIVHVRNLKRIEDEILK